MDCSSQALALSELKELADYHRQSILIEGPPGAGKTYLSKRFANFAGIEEFHVIQPKVSDIRDALDLVMTINNPVMLEIENLDLGVAGAAYTLLKSLEEPLGHVYIVITCRNMQAVPDTIISRSAVVTVGAPTLKDIDLYGIEHNKASYSNINPRLIWQCVRSFSDADEVLNMSLEEVNYYEELASICKFNDTVSNIVWKISHYPSGKECNVELALRAIAELMKKPFIIQCAIDCIRDLNKKRVAPHAILSKFVFNAKYCE